MKCSVGSVPPVCFSVLVLGLTRRLLALPLLALLMTRAFAGESTYKPPTTHYFCTSNPVPKTRYYSGLFDMAASADLEKQAATAFQQFLSGKYGVQATAHCQGNPDETTIQNQLKQQVTQLKASNWKIVETGWKSPNSTSAAATGEASHADCNNADAWKSVAEYKAACEAPAQSAGSQGSNGTGNTNSQTGFGEMQSSNSSGGTQSQGRGSIAGTTLAVRMTEAVDSTKDGPGHQYRAMVTKATTAGNTSIPAGSIAMVMLVKNQSGWAAHLQSLMVRGQTISVSSGPATLLNSTMASAQNMASGAMNTVSSALGGFGFGHKKPHAPSEAEAVASGSRVVLPPGTQLNFVLNSVSAGPSAGFGGGGAAMAQPMGSSPATVGAASNTIAAGTGGALKAKVSEVVLGPSPTKAGGKYVVSPDGGHYAAFAMHGSRELIIIDGVEGPEFDHAGHAYTYGAIDVVFTKDGTHSAYIGQSGDSLIAVIDGKPRATVEQLPKGAGLGEVQGIGTWLNYPPTVSNQPNTRHPILLSPNGAHYACIASDPGKAGSHMILDGVRGPEMMAIDQDQVAFVNEQLIYVGTTPDKQRHVVVNDKLGPEYSDVRYLRVTDDAKHYAFAAQVNGAYTVVVDGKPGTAHHFLTWMTDLVFSSNARTGFMAQLPAGGSVEHNAPVLFVDDHEAAKDVRPFTGLDRMGNPLSAYVVFSSDGAKYAYAKVVPGGVAAVVDGKVGRAYDGIGIIDFSKDSKHAYFVGQRGQYFVVVDGKEMQGVNRMENFIFSNDGMHFAYLAYIQDGNHVVVDGKESPRYYNFIGHSLAFSPDSKHYIYAACTNIMKCEVVRDGNVVTSVPSLSEFSARTLKPVYMFPPVFFSPDSDKVAYSYAKSDGTSHSVYVINGQELVHGTTFEFPSFSPDSKHFVVMGWNGHGYSFFADGKMGPGYQELLEANLNIARFENPNTYRFLGIKNDSVYRVTVDLTSTN